MDVSGGCGQDMFLPALATLPAAWVLAYVPHLVKLLVILSKQRLAGEA